MFNYNNYSVIKRILLYIIRLADGLDQTGPSAFLGTVSETGPLRSSLKRFGLELIKRDRTVRVRSGPYDFFGDRLRDRTATV